MHYIFPIAACLALCLILMYAFKKNSKSKLSTDPIITYYKFGGIVGHDIQLQIYQDNTYKLFSHDKLIKTDTLDLTFNEPISEILNNYHILNNIPKRTTDGNDYLYYSIDVNGQNFSLDTYNSNNEEYKQLISQNKKLFDSINQLELLTDN